MQISYNLLNLAQSVSQAGTALATYVYLADGTKAQVYTGNIQNSGNGYSYLGSLKYSKTGNTLSFHSSAFGGGHIVNYSGSIQPFYYITDHLGSVRVITDTNGSIVEQNDYYPYGSRHTSGNVYAALAGNGYKFNGKEEQTTAGLGYLDYGARMYDTEIGRWGVQDPLAEMAYDLTPYRFSFNNPLRFVDPDGRFEFDKESAKKYPELDKFLRWMLEDWGNKSDNFKSAFYQTSSMNEKQVTQMLTYGSGPKVLVEDLTVIRYGKPSTPHGIHEAYSDIFGNAVNRGSGLIKLDKNITVSYLENASNREEMGAAKMLVESTLFHEGTHFGNTKTQRNVNGIYQESGKAFERRAYGQDIDESNYRDYYRRYYAPILLPKIERNIKL